MAARVGARAGELWRSFLGQRNREIRILVVGLDNSGKSTIINHIKPNKEKLQEIVPTVGFKVETFSKRNITFTMFDMSGQSRYRTIWEHHYHDAEAIIFVLDSADRARICVAKDELIDILNHKHIAGRNIPILFFANKMDIHDAMTPMDIVEEMGLTEIEDKDWHIEKSNAVTGENVDMGITWLSEKMQEQNTRK